MQAAGVGTKSQSAFAEAIEAAVALASLRAVQERAAPGGSPVRSPRATIISAPSGNGRCSGKAASLSAVSHALISAWVVRIAGMTFRWIALTSAFGSVVRKAKRSLVISPSLTFRTELQHVHSPAKKANGRLSSKASHTGERMPSGKTSLSENDEDGTTQRFSSSSQRRHAATRHCGYS
jgi:hypothetical protein